MAVAVAIFGTPPPLLHPQDGKPVWSHETLRSILEGVQHSTAWHGMAQHSVCFGRTLLSSGFLVLVVAAGCRCFPRLPARWPRQLLQLLSTRRLPPTCGVLASSRPSAATPPMCSRLHAS